MTTAGMVEIRTLGIDDGEPTVASVIGAIDRTEHIDIEYVVVDGELHTRPAVITEAPPWDPVGTGPYSVAAHVEFCTSAVARGGIALGAFDAAQAVGLAVVVTEFELPMAWLAFLHVTRSHRRRGVAQALWGGAVDVAMAGGATSMYVSGTPTESAVGFYLSRGCRLADPVHPKLFAEEPDDIHLVCDLHRTR